jgi:hypothetical protein
MPPRCRSGTVSGVVSRPLAGAPEEGEPPDGGSPRSFPLGREWHKDPGLHSASRAGVCEGASIHTTYCPRAQAAVEMVEAVDYCGPTLWPQPKLTPPCRRPQGDWPERGALRRLRSRSRFKPRSGGPRREDARPAERCLAVVAYRRFGCATTGGRAVSASLVPSRILGRDGSRTRRAVNEWRR